MFSDGKYKQEFYKSTTCANENSIIKIQVLVRFEGEIHTWNWAPYQPNACEVIFLVGCEWSWWRHSCMLLLMRSASEMRPQTNQSKLVMFSHFFNQFQVIYLANNWCILIWFRAMFYQFHDAFCFLYNESNITFFPHSRSFESISHIYALNNFASEFFVFFSRIFAFRAHWNAVELDDLTQRAYPLITTVKQEMNITHTSQECSAMVSMRRWFYFRITRGLTAVFHWLLALEKRTNITTLQIWSGLFLEMNVCLFGYSILRWVRIHLIRWSNANPSRTNQCKAKYQFPLLLLLWFDMIQIPTDWLSSRECAETFQWIFIILMKYDLCRNANTKL